MNRKLVYTFGLLLLAGVWSSDGTIRKNENSEDSFQCLVKIGEYCAINAKNGAQGAAVTVTIGLLTKIDEKLFRQAVDKVLEGYHRYPKSTATVGVMISIISLKDSINDYHKIAFYDQMILDALQEQDEDLRLKRLTPIKGLLQTEHEGQMMKVVVKGLCAVGLGWLAYSIVGTSWLFWPISGAAVANGAATAVQVYNCEQFSVLMAKLEQDRHLD